MNRCVAALLPAALCLVALASGCGKGGPTAPEPEENGPPSPTAPGPSDPPYSGTVVFPSGMRLALLRDRALTDAYPAPESNPFGGARKRHYARVGFFIDLPTAPLARQVSPNFRLSEYVAAVQQRGDTRAYVDPQIADHAQQIRSGLGRPLIINSGYRSPEHNRAVGGATYSRHIYGDGVDIDVDQNSPDWNRLAQEIFNEARDVGVDFILPLSETSVAVNGQQRVSWVHIDDRGF